MKKRLQLLLVILVFICCALAGCSFSEAAFQTSNTIKVHYIDVGQGDSILIQVNNLNMLIDAGPEDNAPKLIAYLKKQKISKLHYILATHPHEDHIGGMAEVIKRYRPGKFYAPKAIAYTRNFEDMVNALKGRSLKINPAREGVYIDLGEKTECVMLSPVSESYENLNNYSPVIRITYGKSVFLFTGDAEELAENEIISRGLDIDSDVLKAGHHGSSTSSTKAFLAAVSPDTTVISVGMGNDFGHPNRAVLNSLKSMNTQIYRTDIDSTVVIESDGNRIIKK